MSDINDNKDKYGSVVPPQGYDRHTTSSTELDIIDEYSCSSQQNIMALRRIFLLALRNFFSKSSNFNVTYAMDWVNNFGDYTYSDPIVDPEGLNESTIDIVLSHQYADNASRMEYLKEGQKPQIVITIGDFDYQDTGVIDNLTKNTRTKNSAIISTWNVACNIKISAYGRTYADSAILGQLASSFLIGMRPVMMSRLGLKEYKPLKLAAPVCINSDEALKTFKSEFDLQILFESAFISRKECLIIKTISINNKALEN